MEYVFVYITTANRDQALSIGKALVEERLAACANIIDGMESIYWWEGAVQQDRETVLIAKTRRDLLDRLTARVKDLHSYKVPCIVALPIVSGNDDYLRWLGDETSPEKT